MKKAKEPEFEKVKSSMIDGVGLSEDGNMLLRFNGGKIYEYPTVDEKTQADFLRAESKGKYFAQHIRPNHTGTIFEPKEKSNERSR